MLWRRSYDTPPPPIEAGSEFSQDGDPRYADLGADPARAPSASRTSSTRMLPVLARGRSSRTSRPARTVLVAAHGNSLRALVKHLDGISDDDIAGLNIPTGIPLVYELDEDAGADHPRRHLPRPGGRCRRRCRRGQPGPLRSGDLAAPVRRRRARR